MVGLNGEVLKYCVVKGSREYDSWLVCMGRDGCSAMWFWVPRLTASGEEIQVGLGNKEKVGGMDD